MGVKEELYEEAKNRKILMKCWLLVDREENPHKYTNSDLTQSSTGSFEDSTPNLSGFHTHESSYNGVQTSFRKCSFNDPNEAVALKFGRMAIETTVPMEATSSSRVSNQQGQNSNPGNVARVSRAQIQDPQSYQCSASSSQNLDWKSANDLLYKLDTPKRRVKPDYPFPVQGIVLRDSSSPEERRRVFVFCGRVGRIQLDDDPDRKNKDYAWALAEKPGVYSGREFGNRPTCLISTKFVKNDGVEIRGFAALGFGRNDDEGNWIAWNDAIGSMRIVTSSARLLKKKFTGYNPTLNVIKFIARFENEKFCIKKIDYITNQEERRSQFPEQIFVVKNCVAQNKNAPYKFVSAVFDYPIVVNESQTEFSINLGVHYDIVVCPTFPVSTRLEYVGMCVLLAEDWDNNVELKEIKKILDVNTERILGGNNQNDPDVSTFTNDLTVDGTVLRREILLPPRIGY